MDKKIKIKYLTKDKIIISIDRLTRFKNPEIKYLRVFKDIVINNLIEPKFKKSQLDDMNYEVIRDYAQNIINASLKNILNNTSEPEYSINDKLLNYEKSIFNTNSNTLKLLNNKINYKDIIKILPDNIPDNLKFLKSLSGCFKYSGIFPVKKLILCEGITEEILLPKFSKICGYDFQENGIYIISAGGKNQVVKYFYNYADSCKLPIFVLLDNDAKENFNQIYPKLRQSDKIHIIKKGEFEDLLTKHLILKTLNYTTKNISTFTLNIDEYTSVVQFLEDFFKHRGLHEFKKSDFAQSVKENISNISDVSDEIKEIITEINML